MADIYPYGGELTRNDAVTIGTSALNISTSHNRQEIVVTNTSTGGQVISLSFGKTAEAGAGIVLLPGWAYYATRSEGFRPSSETLSGIASAAGATLAVFER